MADKMVVAAGASSASDTASFQSATYSGYSAPLFESSSYNGIPGYDSYYRRDQNVYQGYSGALDTALGLDATALLDFAGDGALNASVTASIGQFRITGATLTLQVDDAPANGVPEPGTLALAAAAVGAGAAVTRRRRRDTK